MVGLPPPTVSPGEYDESYYLTCCAGHVDWSSSQGARSDPRYPVYLRMAALRPGDDLVDIGCGRGELLADAIEAGARSAVGVEYSPAALELTRQTLTRHAIDGDRARAIAADARALPLPDRCADLVTLLDVVEHLAPAELARTLDEARRILRPGARLFIHSFPNRTIYEVTYRCQRLLTRRRRRTWPRDPRREVERQMHVNEQTVASLSRALRAAELERTRAWAGPGAWVGFVPDERARTLYHRLAAHPATARLGACDVWGEARRST